MSRPESRFCNRIFSAACLPMALAGSLYFASAAQAQVHSDRSRPPQPGPPPAAAPAPAPKPSPPSSAPPPSRASDSGIGSMHASASPARSGGSGKGVDFNGLFSGSPSASRESAPHASHPGDAADSLNRANTGKADGSRGAAATVRGSATAAAQTGTAYDRFQRSLEGSIYRTPPPARVIFGSYSPYYDPYYNPYYDYPSPYPYPYPDPGPFPPYPPVPQRPSPEDRSTPDDSNNPEDYRIGEQDKKLDPLVEQAAQDIRAAWLNGDMELLSKHIRRDVKIEIYVAQKLDRTQDASDFLSDSRYAFDTKTIRFQIESIHYVARNVYKVTARRTSRDAQGFEKTLTLRYLLEKMDRIYIIKRVETDE